MVDSKVAIYELFKDASKCGLCGFENKASVPTPDEKYGTQDVDVMFLYERPGGNGPRRSGKISFNNPDKTAEFTKKLALKHGFITENDWSGVYATNACLCCNTTKTGPKTNVEGAINNREIDNCKTFLKRQIDILKPRVIAPCGKSALIALSLVYPDSKELVSKVGLKMDQIVAKPIINDGVHPPIFPLFHPSPKTQNIYPGKEAQDEQWKQLKQFVDSIKSD